MSIQKRDYLVSFSEFVPLVSSEVFFFGSLEIPYPAANAAKMPNAYNPLVEFPSSDLRT